MPTNRDMILEAVKLSGIWIETPSEDDFKFIEEQKTRLERGGRNVTPLILAAEIWPYYGQSPWWDKVRIKLRNAD